MTIKFGWGWKIALLYLSFVIMILVLVISSSKQKFDLVSADYYKEEIAYQGVLDASKNQVALTGVLGIRASDTTVSINFPAEFSDKVITGNVTFYSAVNKEWDRSLKLNSENNVMSIDRSTLRNTSYTMKLSYAVAGKSYYQESNINLSR
ncbi:MAG: FixH family protein [Taibaiella sp.]|nr:FixH family protein [Taibaiella sp.]